MGMSVDQSGRDDHTMGIDHLLGRAMLRLADVDDPVALDGYVADERRLVLASVDRAARDQRVDLTCCRCSRFCCKARCSKIGHGEANAKRQQRASEEAGAGGTGYGQGHLQGKKVARLSGRFVVAG
jgi:hypothetical protein